MTETKERVVFRRYFGSVQDGVVTSETANSMYVRWHGNEHSTVIRKDSPSLFASWQEGYALMLQQAESWAVIAEATLRAATAEVERVKALTEPTDTQHI